MLRILRNYKSPSGSVLHYSYYDYMDAFEKVLFFQNQNFDHSWFIMFGKDFKDITPKRGVSYIQLRIRRLGTETR